MTYRQRDHGRMVHLTTCPRKVRNGALKDAEPIVWKTLTSRRLSP
ncbi:hypothetical protein DER29_2612 [Micromonospora sp. M71_S20]|nr:hypothetical protein DER29_2612 [Micromonospora sp. M71_S20]